ncbi:helix-turn-helix transcriptional regulator [Listeria grandensis]|uniref:Helix-turn-helix transcriptional regulator n=1 Tax=Listeria grandensis TaxID=1494963 RepID=A0A7X0Y2Q9_9LIST|nr:helix-turn-helix transcriptional regulator [Listeria grandensis]MBC1935940.1 helix-turn-helix transcriptional regulator [Listeria grandensis]
MEKVVVVNLKSLVEKHGISMKELSRLADIEPAILSKLVNNKRQSIYFDHIARIADALDVKDIREIIDIEERE